jgi:hypothetical protein
MRERGEQGSDNERTAGDRWAASWRPSFCVKAGATTAWRRDSREMGVGRLERSDGEGTCSAGGWRAGDLPSIGAWFPSGLAVQLEGGDRSRVAGGARPRGRLQGAAGGEPGTVLGIDAWYSDGLAA